MGFGRIGRNLFRMMSGHPELQVRAIVDIANPAGLAYLLKYDSIYGRYPHPVDYQNGHLLLEDDNIPMYSVRKPSETRWEEWGVDLVVQATGKYRSRAETSMHLETGAKRVVLASTPEQLGDLPILLRGVNEDVFTPDTPILAMGSNTSNALAPILSILDQSFGLERAFFTTVHAMTNSQRLADVPTEGFRSSRAAGENIIPSSTNSPAILEAVLPNLQGKISGMALNVPVMDGSTVDLVTDLRQPVTAEELNTAVKEACTEGFSGVIDYSSDPIVSSDVLASPFSGVFDSLATMVMDQNMVKTITWFNNGWGYTARILEVLETMSTHLSPKGSEK